MSDLLPPWKLSATAAIRAATNDVIAIIPQMDDPMDGLVYSSSMGDWGVEIKITRLEREE